MMAGGEAGSDSSWEVMELSEEEACIPDVRRLVAGANPYPTPSHSTRPHPTRPIHGSSCYSVLIDCHSHIFTAAFHPIVIEVLGNLFEAISGLFRYPTTGRRTKHP